MCIEKFPSCSKILCPIRENARVLWKALECSGLVPSQVGEKMFLRDGYFLVALRNRSSSASSVKHLFSGGAKEMMPRIISLVVSVSIVSF